MTDLSNLSGSWQLDYVSGNPSMISNLFPNKQPNLNVDLATNTVSGNTGCNNFSGKLNAIANKISFRDPMAMTRMMCPGEGEGIFLAALQKVNSWSVSGGNVLNLISDDIAIMRFTKK